MRGVQKVERKLPSQLRRRVTIKSHDFSFPGSARLKRRKEFLRLRECGRKAHSRHFLIVYAPTECLQSRLGIAVTKKIERSSVRRNRMKRILREVFRLHRYRLTNNFDIVIVARSRIEKPRLQDVERELIETLERARLML